MKKKLISAANINEFLSADAKELQVDSSMILTSSAKDYLREKRIRLIYGKKTCGAKVAANCSQDQLKNVVSRIISILRNDLQVRDTAKVERVTQKVLTALSKG